MTRIRKLDNIDMKNTAETRVALLEQSIGHISNTLQRIDNRLDRLDDKIMPLDRKMDMRFDQVNDRMWSIFLWLLSAMTGIALGGLGILAKGFHWF